MTPDPRDTALLRACPCVAVPRYGELAQAEFGQRVLVASNGVFLEVRRAWLDCVVRISELRDTPPLPYGALAERISFTFGVIPVALLDEFVAVGRDALPDEVAGALIYDRCNNTLRLAVHDAIHAGPADVRYRMPALGPGEELAVDLHTHGRLPAFWSATDDADDQGVKVCGVFGDVQRESPSAAFRLAINGAFWELSHPWSSQRSELAPTPEFSADRLTWLATRLTELTEISPWNT